MSNIFSKSTLDRIATPEQLDRQTKIVKPYYWLGIFAFLILVTGIVIWGFFGNINSTVELQGIVFPKAGVTSVNAECTATVQDVLYSTGDKVTKGDIIAVLSDDAKLEEIENIKSQISNEKNLTKKNHLISKKKELYALYESYTIVRAAKDGVIQNIVSVGDKLDNGEQVAAILINSQYSNNRQVVAYVPMRVAKRLKTGMETQICPSYVSREEYGYMEGYISYVGNVPSTDEELKKYYGNVEYVGDIMPDESCVEILISVQVDEDSSNMFKWSNSKGNSLNVEVGTICDIQVIVDNKKPVSLL